MTVNNLVRLWVDLLEKFGREIGVDVKVKLVQWRDPVMRVAMQRGATPTVVCRLCGQRALAERGIEWQSGAAPRLASLARPPVARATHHGVFLEIHTRTPALNSPRALRHTPTVPRKKITLHNDAPKTRS